MSTALTDLLIAVSDPGVLLRYRTDPERTMDEYGLSTEEKVALRSGSAGKIRLHAISVSTVPTTDTDYRQFTSARAASFNPALVEVDPVVEVHLQENEQVAITGKGQLFVDSSGQLFRGIPNG
jgi:hypothetical protein